MVTMRIMKKATFASQLTKLLEQSGMTIYQFAHKCGLHKETLRRYARGERKPTFENAQKIARTLGVTLDKLGDDRRK